MHCIVINGPSFEESQSQIIRAQKHADLLEFRIDLFNFNAFDLILELRKLCTLPVIFTVRKNEQGGHWKESEDQRLKMIFQITSLNPDYIDIEYDVPEQIVKDLKKAYPELKIIRSYHNFEQTPDLSKIFSLLTINCADHYKIATFANSSLDGLRLLSFLKVQPKNKIIGLCMGEYGQFTRIIAGKFGSPFTYSCLEDTEIAPGQLDIATLKNVYNTHKIDKNTSIYCLIGDPIHKSVGHITHNYTFSKLGLNAVYLKICLKKEELEDFFKYADLLNINGLSVTMPLKEAVIPFLTHIDTNTDAVNTIAFRNEGCYGYNTDGIGAIAALEKRVKLKDKLVAVLGAGGSAKSVIKELIAKKAKVTIYNRTQSKAIELAKQWKCNGFALEDFPEKHTFDIVINCTSCGMEGASVMPISSKIQFNNKQLVMDIISNPKQTSLLQHAKDQGAMVVEGLEMFFYQGAAQYGHWFANPINQQIIFQNLQLAYEST